MRRVLAIVAALLVGTACAPADDAVDVELGGEVEFSLSVSPSTVEAGEHTFRVRNTGEVPHDFWVLRTDLAGDELPEAEGVVTTDGTVELREQIRGLDAGAERTLAATLEAGSYVLICNVPGHYQSGMWAGFTVS